MSKCEKINELLSGYIDNELVQSDHQLVEIHLRSCEQCQREYNDMKKLRDAVANSSVEMEFSEKQLEMIMNDLPAKATHGIGWILVLTGFMTLIGFAIWQFAVSDDPPWYIKAAVSAVAFGFLSLFISVLRQRLVALKTDRYQDVQI